MLPGNANLPIGVPRHLGAASIPRSAPLDAGVALTASNLIFTGEVGGYFDAHDAQSGKVLYRFNLAASMQGGVITYSAHSVQHVAVVSGDGGVMNKKSIPEISGGNPTITVFAIPPE